MANLSNIITPTNVLTATSTNTVTNKTINASNNTVTNVSLTTAVTGTLPVTNGGTGLASPGATGNVLTSNGTAWTSAAAPADGPAISPIGGFFAYDSIGNVLPTFSRISDGVYAAAFSNGNLRVITYADGTFTSGAAAVLSPNSSQMAVVMLSSTVGLVLYNGLNTIRAFSVSGTTITLTGTALAIPGASNNTRSIVRISDTSAAVVNRTQIIQYSVSAGQVALTRNIASSINIPEITLTALSPTLLLAYGYYDGGATTFFRSYLFNGTSWTNPSSLNTNNFAGILPTNPKYTGNIYNGFALQGSPPDRFTLGTSVSVNTTTGVITSRYLNASLYLPSAAATTVGESVYGSVTNAPPDKQSTISYYKLDTERTLIMLAGRIDLSPTAYGKTGIGYPAIYVFNDNSASTYRQVSGLVPINLPLSIGVAIIDYIESSKTLIINKVESDSVGGLVALSMKGYL